MNNKAIDYTSLEVDGIDTLDHPDYCDAYFSKGLYEDGTPISDSELEILSSNGELLHEKIMEVLY